MGEYQLLNKDGAVFEEHIDPCLRNPNLFAKVVARANECAKLYGRPVRVMGHQCDADDKHRFQSELYVAQP